MSMPSDDLNSDDRVMVKRPEPEYASIKCLTLWSEVGGRIWSRMYCVNMGRMELLFWKKEPAGLTNWKSSMYSVLLAFGSVTHVLRCRCSPRSSMTASGSCSSE